MFILNNNIWYDILNYRASSTSDLVGSHSNILDLCDLEMGAGHTELVHISHKLHRLLQTKVEYQRVTLPSSITALSLKININWLLLFCLTQCYVNYIVCLVFHYEIIMNNKYQVWVDLSKTNFQYFMWMLWNMFLLNITCIFQNYYFAMKKW